MGCCIPKKPCISFVNTNKKSTQIKTTINEKTYDFFNIKDLNKSLASLELKKYYLSSPIPDIKLNNSSNMEFNCSFQNIKNKKKKNKKKIKESMKKLKELSSREVNNCQKYFKMKILNEKRTTNNIELS